LGSTPIPLRKEKMNENKKLINIRLTPKEKAQMESLAEICGLSLSEYLRKRGLGYEPRPLLSDSFYLLYSKLCDLCNQQMTAETQSTLLELIADIRRELLLPSKQTRKEVAEWRQPDSGRSKES